MEMVYNRRKEFEVNKRFHAQSDFLVPEEERSYKKYKDYEDIPKEENSDLKVVDGKIYDRNISRIIELVKDTKSF